MHLQNYCLFNFFKIDYGVKSYDVGKQNQNTFKKFIFV